MALFFCAVFHDAFIQRRVTGDRARDALHILLACDTEQLRAARVGTAYHLIFDFLVREEGSERKQLGGEGTEYLDFLDGGHCVWSMVKNRQRASVLD